jgi:hypothetical protein
MLNEVGNVDMKVGVIVCSGKILEDAWVCLEMKSFGE